MRSTRVRVLPVLLFALAGSALVAVQSPANAAVTTTTITAPADGFHFLITDANYQSPPTVPVTGTSNGTTGDLVDLKCYGVGTNEYQNGPQNVPVQADGTFSTTLSANDPYGTCLLVAVPNNFPDGSSLTGINGVRVTTEYVRSYKVASGPNAGKTYDYNVIYQGSKAIFDIVSATHEGYWDARLTHPDGLTSNYLWSGAASLRTNPGDARSRIRVDGRDAYGPWSAEHIIAGDTPGGPSLTWSVTRDGTTGVTRILEKSPLVRCPAGTAYPPTAGTCPQFSSAGVRLERSYVVTDGGRQVHVSDVWRSTDGKSHTISAHYNTEVHGFDYRTLADTPVALQLPWLGGFQTFSGDATFAGPTNLANSVHVRDSNTAVDGDIWLPRGAVTFDFPTKVHRTAYDTFALEANTFTVPANSSRLIRQSFVMGTTDAEIQAKAAANKTRINPYRADAQIKKSGAPAFKGNNVYNTTGASQYVLSNQKRSTKVTFLIAVQNDGTRTQSFRIKGSTGINGFVTQYFTGASGGSGVTYEVREGRYGLQNLAPGEKRYLRLVITVNSQTEIGKLRYWLITATPVSDPTRKDVVKAMVKVVS